MADPVILIVDDEPQVRNAVERELQQKYEVDIAVSKPAPARRRSM